MPCCHTVAVTCCRGSHVIFSCNKLIPVGEVAVSTVDIIDLRCHLVCYTSFPYLFIAKLRWERVPEAEFEYFSGVPMAQLESIEDIDELEITYHGHNIKSLTVSHPKQK